VFGVLLAVFAIFAEEQSGLQSLFVLTTEVVGPLAITTLKLYEIFSFF